MPVPVHLDVMLRNYHMCISQFFISHYLPPFHPSNLIIDQGSPRKKSNSKACGAIFMLLATFSWSELFHELCMHQCHLEKKSKNTFGFSRPTADFDFPFGQGPMTYAFTQDKFLLLLRPSTPFKAHIPVLRLKPQPQGPNPSLQAQISA